jgi:hypothetical protein
MHTRTAICEYRAMRTRDSHAAYQVCRDDDVAQILETDDEVCRFGAISSATASRVHGKGTGPSHGRGNPRRSQHPCAIMFRM